MAQQPVPPPIRVPLVYGIEQRTAGSDKDELAENIFYDSNTNVDHTMYGLHEVLNCYYATKRPGIESFISASGQGQGIYTFDNELFSWNGLAFYWRGIIWTGTEYIAVLTYTADFGFTTAFYSATSSNGITWLLNNTGIATGNSGLVNGIAYNGTVYCTVTNQSGVAAKSLVTSNGITWTTGVLIRQGNHYVTALGSTFIALTQDFSTAVATSTDGINWTNRVATVASSRCIGANSSIAIILPYNNSTTYYTSTDGINWTGRTLGVSGGFWNSIAWSDTLGMFVAVRSETGAVTGTIISSTTGTSWTSRVSSGTRDYKGVFWTGTHFIASFTTHDVTSQIGVVTSTDGINWTEQLTHYGVNHNIGAGNSNNQVLLQNDAPISQETYSDSNFVSSATKSIPTLYNPGSPTITAY